MSEKFVSTMKSKFTEKITEENENKNIYTWNGALSNSSPDNSGETKGRLSLFYKSIRGISEEKLEKYLSKSVKESILDTFLISFYIRDCREGKGEREIGRNCLKFLLSNNIDTNIDNNIDTNIDNNILHNLLPCVVEYGRWDDLFMILENEYELSVIPGINSENTINAIFKFFSKQLQEDLKNMNSNLSCTLAAKWAPTENCSIDKKYKAVERICSFLKVSKRNYRKVYISPLRSHLGIVETYMCNNEWEKINYSQVPSRAMKKLNKAFARQDAERFKEWKTKLKSGEVKINAKQIYPHEIIKDIMHTEDTIILEAQWKVLIEQTKKLGVFKNSISIVDVSGSMGSVYLKKFEPIHAAVSLGMTIAECMEGPLKNKIITFHHEPKFCEIEGETLKERFISITNIPWGMSTDFQKIFELILTEAKNNSLSQEDMPEKIYVLSDMQFNKAFDGKTNYNSVKDKYAEYNYTLPKIIFWNMNGKTEDFPCTVDDNETCMISGFSTAILKNILSLSTINPYSILRVSIDSERYNLVRKAFQVSDKTPSVLEGSVLEGSVLEGSVLEGSVLEGSVLEKNWFGSFFR
jgi:hypothetical protein